jgi:hypothetical protein
VYRPAWSELTDRETVQAALSLFVSHGYLAEVEKPATDGGGRPTVAYLIPPSVRREVA